ncbi:MAG: rhodanese-like domain-containing protein [Phycisphaeraceae bacterium]
MNPPTIDPNDLKARLERRDPVRLIDVRTPGEYRAEHLEPAELMPLDQLDARAFLQAPPGVPIYLLCQSGKRASTAYGKLAVAGVSNMAVVKGGLSACKQANLPLVKGQGVISLERQVRIGAGMLVLLGVLLGWVVHPTFYGIAGFVGAGLFVAGVTDFCGMAMLLARMPWNQRDAARPACRTG